MTAGAPPVPPVEYPTIQHANEVGQAIVPIPWLVGAVPGGFGWVVQDVPPLEVVRMTSAPLSDPTTQQLWGVGHAMERSPFAEMFALLGMACVVQLAPALVVARISGVPSEDPPSAQHAVAFAHVTENRCPPRSAGGYCWLDQVDPPSVVPRIWTELEAPTAMQPDDVGHATEKRWPPDASPVLFG
jgi:hypothetical protein